MIANSQAPEDEGKNISAMCLTDLKKNERNSSESKMSLEKTESGDDFTRRNNNEIITEFDMGNLPTLKKGEGYFSDEKFLGITSPESPSTKRASLSLQKAEEEQEGATKETKKNNKSLNRSLDISSLYDKGDSKLFGRHFPLVESSDGDLDDGHSFDKKILYEDSEVIFNASTMSCDEKKEYNVPKQKRFSLRKESIEPVNFPDVWFRVKQLKLINERKLVHKENSQGWNILKKYLCSCIARKLPNNLLTEQDQILAYSKVSFREDNQLHFRMLYTIYITLTLDQNCARVGQHWERIGFSDEDPAKLLSKTGMFGILQIIAFVTFHRKFFLHAYKYSRDEECGFPFCDQLLKISHFTLKSLKQGYLRSLIESQKSVINAANNLFFAMFYKTFRFYQRNRMRQGDLKALRKTIGADIRRVPELAISDFSQEINKYMNKHPVVKKLEFELK